jgi:glycosyltransferase involved in cell wall biosynthesis
MKVSVCLASYNGEKYILEQVTSILNQLRQFDELIVSDDCSDDATVEILRQLGDERIKILSGFKSPSIALNFSCALRAATGDIIMMCDQDDVWKDGHVDEVLNWLEDYDLVISNGVVVDRSLEPMGIDVFSFVRFRRGFFANFLRNSFVGCCMSFRRSVLNATLPFPPGVVWHDWYIGLIASLFFRVGVCDTQSMLFRRHDGNASSTGLISSRKLSSKVRDRFSMACAVCLGIIRVVSLRLRREATR